jgi:putative two-component system response regulator
MSLVGRAFSIHRGTSLTRRVALRERSSPSARSERATVASRERTLVAAVQQLSQARSLEEIQQIVRSAARRLTGADGATFVIREEEDCHYVDEDAISPLIPHDAYRPTFVKSLAMVPIRQQDPLGAIGNYWATRHRPTGRDLGVLQALADSTAVAIENVRITKELERSRLETLSRLALAAEYRDDGTRQHTERVARTSRAIAAQLGLPASLQELICQAAPLHDVGKLAVPDAILLKPGKLTPAEFEQVKRHTTTGGEILADGSSEVLRLAEEIALTHHEWWDGSGYPAGLAGNDIPVSGRIVGLADVFDALTHERPYKQAATADQAIAEIRRLKGCQFDPKVIEAFLHLDADEFVELPAHY